MIIRFMDTDDTTSALASEYFHILIWGAPPYLATFALSGWFLGMQNSKVTMWTSILINVTNIVAKPLARVHIPPRDSGYRHRNADSPMDGILCPAASGSAALFRRRAPLRDIFDMPRLKRFFRVNTDIFLRTVCLVSVTMWFTRMGAIQGERMLAVNALLMQFLHYSHISWTDLPLPARRSPDDIKGAADHMMMRRAIRAPPTLGSRRCNNILHHIYPCGRPVATSAEFRPQHKRHGSRVSALDRNSADCRISCVHMGRYIYRSHGHTAHAYVYGDGHRSILHCRDHSISTACQPRAVAGIYHIPVGTWPNPYSLRPPPLLI